MKINLNFDFVDGQFDSETGKLICVRRDKYARVDLCLNEGCSNISFARIRLHSADLHADAMKVIDDAKNLGDEIAKRWNEHHKLKQRVKELESQLVIVNKASGLNNQNIRNNDESNYWPKVCPACGNDPLHKQYCRECDGKGFIKRK